MANFIVLDPRRATQASLQPEDEVVLIDAQYDRTLSLRNPLVAVLWATLAVSLGCGVAWPHFGFSTLVVLVPCFIVWLYAGGDAGGPVARIDRVLP